MWRVRGKRSVVRWIGGRRSLLGRPGGVGRDRGQRRSRLERSAGHRCRPLGTCRTVLRSHCRVGRCSILLLRKALRVDSETVEVLLNVGSPPARCRPSFVNVMIDNREDPRPPFSRTVRLRERRRLRVRMALPEYVPVPDTACWQCWCSPDAEATRGRWVEDPLASARDLLRLAPERQSRTRPPDLTTPKARPGFSRGDDR